MTINLSNLLPNFIKPYNLAGRRVKRLTGGRVFSGPFAGMSYVTGSVCSAWYPKILGTYELELHDCLKSISGKHFDTFVDIGAAEGYYAIGMNRLIDCSRVVAFEATESGRALIRELAEKNGIASKLEIRGFCTPEEFKKLLETQRGSMLVICDIEGGEDAVLMQQTPELLKNATLIVETHEFAVSGITDKLIQKFSTSHRIERIHSRERHSADIPQAIRSPLWNRWIVRMMGEERPMTMDWLIMHPLAPIS